MSDASNISSTADDLTVVDAVVQTTFLVVGVLNATASKLGLSLTQLRLIGIVRDRQVRMSALADFLGLDKSTMSGLVDRTASRGLVERVPDPHDSRAVLVLPTLAGIELAATAYARIEDRLRPTLDRLTSAQQERLRELLGAALGRAK